MNNKQRTAIHDFLIVSVVAAGLTASTVASADDYARVEGPAPRRDNPATYPLELEPHFAFGAENVYGASGFGAGLRVGVPLFAGWLGSVPDNLAISFGGDILHYDNCYYANDCGANSSRWRCSGTSSWRVQ